MSGQRGRPPQDQGKALDTLDEIEQLAKSRIKADGRASLQGKLQLNWSDKDPDYHYFWASDAEKTPLPLQSLLEAGYEFNRYSTGMHKGEKIVKASKGCKLYLMRIPVELHQENMSQHANRVNLTEKQLLGLGEREYAGDSKELGKGAAISANYTESPLLNND